MASAGGVGVEFSRGSAGNAAVFSFAIDTHGFYFGVDAQFWLNLQTRYDLMMLDQKKSTITKEVRPLPKAA